jgi:small subunit ribosomal protein S17
MSATKVAKTVTRQLNAVVVTSGLMAKTVKARIGVQQWNSYIQKVWSSSFLALYSLGYSTLGLCVCAKSGNLRTREVKLMVMGTQNYSRRRHVLVHDPRSSLRAGDIISISPGWRTSRHVKHIVNSIIAPYGEPIEARPPVPSREELLAEKEAKKSKKTERKRLRLLAEKIAPEEAKEQEE